MKASVWMIAAVIISLFLASGWYQHTVRQERSSKAPENQDLGNISALYSSYVSGKPRIDKSVFYGKADAPIMFAAYMDLSSGPSRRFMKEVFPQLKSDFIDTGKMKFYAMDSITYEDLTSKDEAYNHAIVLSCVQKLKPKAYYDLLFDLIDTNMSRELEYDSLLSKHGLPKEEFINCTGKYISQKMTQELRDNERLNNAGISPIFYIGIDAPTSMVIGTPDYIRMKRIINDYLRMLGTD